MRIINKKIAILLFIFTGIVWGSAYGASMGASNTRSLSKSKKIESFIQSALPNTSIGIVLLEADTGKALYEQHAEESFPPASNTKLFTAAAALVYLGSDYRFETAIKTDKSNNLFIQFSGDPSLTIADLKQLISEIKAQGINEITNDILIDNTRFQAPQYPLGWTWDALMWYYGAPVTTVILNENQIAITLTPHPLLGEKADVTLASTETAKVKVSSEIITVSPEESETQCQFQMETNAQNDIHLKGCWPYSPNSVTLKVALKDPNVLMEQTLLEILASENIVFKGKIIYGAAPKDLKTLASHQSKPLSELLKKVLEDSNNLYSESIAKTLGVERFQHGTFQSGVLAIKEILSKPTGIDFTKVTLMDGSGLSLYNLVTPHQLSRVLYAMYQDKKTNKIFNAILPVGGENGTLQNRMATPEVKSKIRAKTGSLSGVSTLAGYLTTLQGKNLIFVIMIDHVVQGKKAAEQFEDELCRLFITSEW